MKVAIVGGSAHSTPALFDTEFALEPPDVSFAFIGRSRERLAAVERAARLTAAHRGRALDGESIPLDDLARGLAGAAIVLVQFRVGGYAARAWDETFPHRYDLCGDEGLGPGGLACAWRTWDELRRTLATIERVAPAALVLLMTSPVGILTACARRAFPRLTVLGICELPWTTLRERCGAAATRTGYAYVGVNHLGWFADVGDDARVHPLKYVRLHDAPAAVLREQRAAAPRGLELEATASAAFATYAAGSPAAVVEAVRRRRTPWYADAIAPFLRAWAGAPSDVTFFLTAANAGYTALVDDDAIIEMPFTVRAGALARVATRPWPRPEIGAVFARLVAYERLAATAVIERDAGALAVALRAHPWLDGHRDLRQLAADVLAPPGRSVATSVR